jgi:hypothetical protein
MDRVRVGARNRWDGEACCCSVESIRAKISCETQRACVVTSRQVNVRVPRTREFLVAVPPDVVAYLVAASWSCSSLRLTLLWFHA